MPALPQHARDLECILRSIGRTTDQTIDIGLHRLTVHPLHTLKETIDIECKTGGGKIAAKTPDQVVVPPPASNFTTQSLGKYFKNQAIIVIESAKLPEIQ